MFKLILITILLKPALLHAEDLKIKKEQIVKIYDGDTFFNHFLEHHKGDVWIERRTVFTFCGQSIENICNRNNPGDLGNG